MWGTQKLTNEAMERSLRSLKAFVHMAEAMEVDTIKAVATAAVRLAKNGDIFIKTVKEQTGLDLECIAGEEEARLGFLGVINTIGLKDFIIFDLGGASTEVTLVTRSSYCRGYKFANWCTYLDRHVSKRGGVYP